jgi:hypothetical protein
MALSSTSGVYQDNGFSIAGGVDDPCPAYAPQGHSGLKVDPIGTITSNGNPRAHGDSPGLRMTFLLIRSTRKAIG